MMFIETHIIHGSGCRYNLRDLIKYLNSFHKKNIFLFN